MGGKIELRQRWLVDLLNAEQRFTTVAHRKIADASVKSPHEPSRMDYTITFDAPAERVYQDFTDRQYWDALMWTPTGGSPTIHHRVPLRGIRH